MITNLIKNRRRGLWLTLSVCLVCAVLCSVYSVDTMKRRAQQIEAGMSRDEVEQIFGPPVLTLRKHRPGTGEVLCWTDMFWQIDVRVDASGSVETIQWVYANSPIRRTQSRLESLLP